MGRTPASAPDPQVRLTPNLIRMLEARADEGVGPQSGGPPHDADLFNELLIQDTSWS